MNYSATSSITKWQPPEDGPFAAGVDKASTQKRHHTNIFAVCAVFFLPWIMFVFACGLLSFQIHFQSPWLCAFLLTAAFFFVAACGVSALREWRLERQRSEAVPSHEQTWFVFLFFTCLFAWTAGVLLGEINYLVNMQSYYSLTTLNSYTNVNPQNSGSNVMDAGRLSFMSGSYIDTSKAIGFKKVDTYCIAPVTSSKTPLLTYDFWATGVNCCSGEPGDFHCGEINGRVQLGGGERVLNNQEIPWFTLATQQAQAYYKLRVGHAIFFNNVADPIGAESQQLDAGVKFFCFWSLLFFGWQFVWVVDRVLGGQLFAATKTGLWNVVTCNCCRYVYDDN